MFALGSCQLQCISSASYRWMLPAGKEIVARNQPGLNKYSAVWYWECWKSEVEEKIRWRLPSFDAFINKVRQRVSLGQCLPLWKGGIRSYEQYPGWQANHTSFSKTFGATDNTIIGLRYYFNAWRDGLLIARVIFVLQDSLSISFPPSDTQCTPPFVTRKLPPIWTIKWDLDASKVCQTSFCWKSSVIFRATSV